MGNALGGAGGSLLPDEAALLTSFTGPAPWPFDDVRWQDLLRWKVPPHTVSGAALRAELAPYAARAAANAGSRNIATLAAHVALRLPKAWFFSRTDVWMLTTAVTLLRSFATALFAGAGGGGYADALAPLIARPNPPTGSSVPELEGWGWPTLVAAALDYLATGKVDVYQYDLHVAVAELLLVLFSPQAAAGEPLLRGLDQPPRPARGRSSAANQRELSADAAVDAALERLRAGAPGEAGMRDAFLRAAMALGSDGFFLYTGQLNVSAPGDRRPIYNPAAAGRGGAGGAGGAAGGGPGPGGAGAPAAVVVGAASPGRPPAAAGRGTTTPSGSAAGRGGSSGHPFEAVAAAAEAAGATRAALVLRALLRNVTVDGNRTDDSATDGVPSAGSAAARASLAVVSARRKALAAHAAAGAAGADAAAPSSGLSGAILTAAGAALSVASAAAALPVALVSDVIAPGPGEPLPRPLAERSALLALLLLHNCRAKSWPPEEDAAAAAVGAGAGAGGAGGDSAGAAAGAVLRRVAPPPTDVHYFMPNPYRAALESLVDSGLPEQSYDEAATAAAVAALLGGKGGGGGGMGFDLPGSRAVLAATRDPSTCTLGVPFKALFSALSRAVAAGPLGTVLLYTLQHGCPAWRAHAFARADIDALVVPLLAGLHRIEIMPHDDRYMTLISLMMLTQDATFCETAFRRVVVKSRATAPWYTERRLGNISLGSLIMLVLHRAVAVVSASAGDGAPPPPAAGAGAGALAAVPVAGGAAAAAAAAGAAGSAAAHAAGAGGVGPDPHALGTLHQNVFAAAANLAPHAEGLHPAAAARMLATLGTLHRRHRKTEARIRALVAAVGSPPDASSISLADPTRLPAAAAALGLPPDARADDVYAAVYRLSGTADVFASSLSLALETLLACTAPGLLQRNTALLYALLRERAVVDALAVYPGFEFAAAPLAELVAHFGGLVARAETDRSLAAALSGSGGAAEASALRAVKARVDAGPASAAGGAPPPPGRAAGAPGPPPAPGGGVGGTDGFDGDTSTLGGARAGGDAAAAALALAAAGGRPASVAWEEADVLAVLADGTKRGAWPSSEAAAAVAAASKRHPFEYKEAHNPEAFFVPYLWCLAYGYAAESVGWTAGDFAGAAAAADGRAPTPDAAAAAGGAGGGGAPRQPAAPGPLFVSPAPRSGGRA